MNTKKIAVATNDKVKIANRLGHCKYFAIFTISPDEIIKSEFIENSFIGHHKQKVVQLSTERQKSEGCNHDGLSLALSDCEVLLSGGMGTNVWKKLSESGIKAYVVQDGGNIEEIISNYLSGKLNITSDIDGSCGCSRHKHKA